MVECPDLIEADEGATVNDKLVVDAWNAEHYALCREWNRQKIEWIEAVSE